MNLNDQVEVARTWNNLSTDEGRWKYLITVKNHGLIVWIDNDQTGVRFKDGGDDFDIDLNSFRSWIGNDCGIPILLGAIGVEFEKA